MSNKPTREEVRAAMPADMVDFIEALREVDPEVKITSLNTPTLIVGSPGDRGLSLANIVINEPKRKNDR